MSILCDDPAERALVPLGTIYTVECKTKAGGYCQASAAQHLSELLVVPDLEYDRYKAMIRKQILQEAKEYARLWETDARTIKVHFQNTIFDSKKRYVNLVFGWNTVATYTIRDKYDFEKYEHSF